MRQELEDLGIDKTVNRLSSVQVFSPRTMSWRPSYHGRTAECREGGCAGFMPGIGIVSAGGYNSNPFDGEGQYVRSCEVFREGVGRYGILPNTKEDVYKSAGCVLDGRFFIAGGGDEDEVDKLQVFDGTAWSLKADLPPTPGNISRTGAAAVECDGKVMVVGGGTDIVLLYDPTTDEWEEGEPLPRPIDNCRAYSDGGLPVVFSCDGPPLIYIDEEWFELSCGNPPGSGGLDEFTVGSIRLG